MHHSFNHLITSWHIYFQYLKQGIPNFFCKNGNNSSKNFKRRKVQRTDFFKPLYKNRINAFENALQLYLTYFCLYPCWNTFYSKYLLLKVFFYFKYDRIIYWFPIFISIYISCLVTLSWVSKLVLKITMILGGFKFFQYFKRLLLIWGHRFQISHGLHIHILPLPPLTSSVTLYEVTLPQNSHLYSGH